MPGLDSESHSIAMADYRVSYVARWLDDMKAVAEAEASGVDPKTITMPGTARWQHVYRRPRACKSIVSRLQRWCDDSKAPFLAATSVLPPCPSGVTMRDRNRLIHCVLGSALDAVRAELKFIDKSLVGLKCYHADVDEPGRATLGLPTTQRL
ncbi:uncharacterized protein ACA1_363190 [Acanthamoeba castellanii str. Neff]|uniref:Uncharacterized protein n=1 Tax=Acanthamoeba castellanii (strain ATCC 30010 / Neff) TaxID=1257118 RepID=L8GFF7_ACACF|nr:uncharacterized protein ACA1_363190 [Acanthamoeba castellanii str. Neff]ELR11820.1 hypothetical protein ACA1_363190 [Acanthamoeba castellanii str. Neff]